MTEFFDTIVRVRYAETDQMGFVYYGNYYIYFEVGRVEYMRHQGVDYKQMEIQDDSFIVVAESKCRYRRPARYDDLLRIRTVVCDSHGKPKTLPEKYRRFFDGRTDVHKDVQTAEELSTPPAQ